jgi:mono/diheme cytochrome c family protein
LQRWLDNLVPLTPSGEKSGFPRRILIFVAFCVLALMAAVSIGNWVEYERVRNLKNPLPPNAAAIAAGKQLYGDHCQKCHGVSGDGRGPKAEELSVSPGNFTDPQKMSGATDGELFWRITRGRYPMPAFEDKISEEGRWQLVDYIRTFQRKTGAGDAAPATRPYPGAVTKSSPGRRTLP